MEVPARVRPTRQPQEGKCPRIYLRCLKVELDSIKNWVKRRMIELMGEEDDIVINFAIEQLEQENTGEHQADKKLDPKKMQIYLTGKIKLNNLFLLGFLEERAETFMLELWRLLLSAQNEPTGIPPELIREKLDEKQRKMEQI